MQLAREALKLSNNKNFDDDLVMVLVPYGTAEEYKAMLSLAQSDFTRQRLIDALLDAHQIDKAIQYARTIHVVTLWDDPDEPYRDAAILQIARRLAAFGEIDRALQLIQGLETYAWGRSDALLAVASAAARKGQPEKAEALLKSVIDGETEYNRSDEAETRALIAAARARAGKWADAAAMATTAKAAAMGLSGDAREKALGAVAFALAEGGLAREATALANEHFRLVSLFAGGEAPEWEDAWKIAGMWTVLGRYDRARLAAYRSKDNAGEFRALTEILEVYGTWKGTARGESMERH